MATKNTFRYSKGYVGLPTVFVALGGVALWFLWPSFHVRPDALGRRRPTRTHVSYGTVSESLYMSPMLFARSTRVGFQAPETASDDVMLDDGDFGQARLRYLHVPPPEPDFSGMHVEAPALAGITKRGDGYRPVWGDRIIFDEVQETHDVVIDVRGPLKARAFSPAAFAWPETAPTNRALQVEAFVSVGADGAVQDVFVEGGCGDASVDATVVRALERGTAAAGDGPALGRVVVTKRRMK